MGSLKSFLRTNPLTRGLYSKLSKAHRNKVLKRKRKKMAQYGVQTLHYLQDLFEGIDCGFFFDMGTLLGIVRDGHLLKHDIDIDVAVFADSEEAKAAVKQAIIAGGSKILYSYAIDGMTVEESYTYNGIKFDVNYYSRRDDADVCYLMYFDPDKVYESNDILSVVRLECNTINGVEKLDFCGKLINVPNDSKGYLAQRYGAGWTVPDLGYVYWKGPSANLTDLVGRRTTYGE